MAGVELRQLHRRFGDVVALAGIDLEIPSGEFVSFLGPSGCGKTTALRLIAGFDRPTSGRILVDGKDITGVPPNRRDIGMVFQAYSLFPHMTARQNVEFGLEMRRRDKAARRARTDAMLELVGLGGHAAKYAHQLSGGQQQRVALARALAPNPELVLLDEPWSNIDPHLRGTMRDELARILRAIGVTVVLVTHDREEAFSLADRIALMRAGTVVQEGTPEEVYLSPATRWAAEFVGAGNFLPGRIEDGLVETLLGRFPVANLNGARAVQALIRPEQLELELQPQGTGEVVAREFRGHDVFYRVRLDGVELVSQRPSNEVVPLGARVSVRPHASRVTVFP